MSDWGPYQHLSELIANAQAATVRITYSTAVMISDRYAITAAHSPLDANNEITPNLTVQNLWGEVRNIVNVFYVVEEDFAIVELESPFENSYAVKLADASPAPGDSVFQVGNPGVVANSGIGWAVSFGFDYDRQEEPWIDVFDIPTSGGNSGGGIYNEKGELVGITSVGFRGDKKTPWYNENFQVSNGIEPINDGWLNGSINLAFIKDFLAKHNVENKPVFATESDLPANSPDPQGKSPVDSEDLSFITTLASVDRESSVVISNLGAESSESDVFRGGGSGTLIHDNLILTVMHALDNREVLSVGYYNEQVDGSALTYRVSKFGDFGLVKSALPTDMSFPQQEVAVNSLRYEDSAYLIGSPRKYWFSEGGWQVSAAVAINTRAVESGAWDSGGASGGSIFNLNSDLVGVIAIGYGPSPRGARSVLGDRQDPHSTNYAPAILNEENLPITGSSDFFFMKKFVSEFSPNSINAATDDFFNVGAAAFESFIYEWGWHTRDGKNTGYLRRYTIDGVSDDDFADQGLFETPLGTYNEQIKAVFLSGAYITAFGEYTRNGVQNIFQARITLSGEIDQTWGLNGFRFFDSDHDQSLDAVARDGDSYMLAGTQFDKSGLNSFTMKVDENGLDKNYGENGVSIIVIPNSSEMSADIITREGSSYLLVNSDKSGEWDSLIIKVDESGNLDSTFGDDGIARADYKDDFNFGIRLLDVDDGLVITGHTYYSIRETPLLSKFSYNGSIDPSFGDNGSLLIPNIAESSIVADAKYDEEIVLASSAMYALQANEAFGDVIKDDSRRPAIYRITKDGRILSSQIMATAESNKYSTSLVKIGTGYRTFVANEDYSGFSSAISEFTNLVVMPSGQVQAKPEILSGQTFIGTDASEVMRSYNIFLRFYGMGGDDTINPSNPKDNGYVEGLYADGGSGDDRLIGTRFADTLIGGGGFDHLSGQGGDDQLYASPDGGELHGHDGIDTAFIPYSISEFGRFSGSMIYLLANPNLIYDLFSIENIVFSDWSGPISELESALSFPEEDKLEITLHPYLDQFFSIASLDLTITAGVAHNTIFVRGGDDIVTGGWGDDRIYTGDGNDTLIGGPGNDVLDGGRGIDTAAFSLSLDEYRIERKSDFYAVTNLVTGEQDTLKKIERFEFNDKKLAMDLDGNAGSIAKLLGAFLGAEGVRSSEYVSIGLEALDSGVSFQDLIQLALDTVFGSRPSSNELVSTFYENLTGQTAPQSVSDTYANLIDSGSLTPLNFATQVAEHPLNAENIDLIGLATTGLEFV